MFFQRFVVGIATLLFALSVPASRFDKILEQTEYSLQLTGSIDIDRSGTVVGHAFDQKVKLDPLVAKTLQDNVARWRFEPPELEAHAESLRAPMALYVVLSPHGEDAFAIRIVGASFGELPKEERLAFKGSPRTLPYPGEAQRSGVTGNVHLVMKIGRDGRPLEVMAEQVNLTFVDSEPRMAHWRDILEDAAIRNARYWRFTVPSAGPEVDAPYWTARVPVAFVLSNRPKAPKAGKWEAYIPGPVREIPWARAQDNTVGIGALAFGEVHTARSTPKLLTPVDGA